MSSYDFRSGIGRLLLVPGPDGTTVRTVAEPPVSALFGAPVETNILLDAADDLDRADLPLIASVLGCLDQHLEAGLDFVRAALAADPAFFGLATAPASVELDSPQLNFYADDEWHLRFAEGNLPICDPYGLAVVFHGQRPMRVEDLSDATALDDGEWDVSVRSSP
ncbi:hypothetical protein [Kitasatospora sp. NPDC101183]|uniref:hypothetical protein n=1 Tax=Kitasatospora sp. NPDC101183 TaxID=3364100 RepID=UPI0037FA0542